MEEISIAELASPVGRIVVVAVGQRACAIDFADRFSPKWRGSDVVSALLCRRLPGARPGPGPSAARIARHLEGYLAGDLRAVEDLVVDTGGTAAQQAVWSALRQIPAGETRSYGELARRIGRPRAARAVGAAAAANPVAIVVPCHRLVGSDGALTGYAGGLERKRWLIAHEARHARQPAPTAWWSGSPPALTAPAEPAAHGCRAAR